MARLNRVVVFACSSEKEHRHVGDAHAFHVLIESSSVRTSMRSLGPLLMAHSAM